jgi:transposase
MELTREHLGLIAKYLPTPRKPPKDTLNFLNAVLYTVENGSKWRSLPKEFGKWHTVYVRFNRWCKNGTLKRIFEGLKEEGAIDIDPDFFCLDSMTVCVHPDGTGALHASGEQSLGRSKGGSRRRLAP